MGILSLRISLPNYHMTCLSSSQRYFSTLKPDSYALLIRQVQEHKVSSLPARLGAALNNHSPPYRATAAAMKPRRPRPVMPTLTESAAEPEAEADEDDEELVLVEDEPEEEEPDEDESEESSVEVAVAEEPVAVEPEEPEPPVAAGVPPEVK